MYLTMVNTLRRRRSVPLDLFYAYWRDTHCGISARLPGLYNLQTHWVSWDDGRSWPSLAGVESELPEEQRFDGVPEPSYLTAEDMQAFGAAMAPLMNDEHNIFEKTIGYSSLGANSTTVKDQLNPAPNGELGSLSYLLFVRQRPHIPAAEFRGSTSEVARLLAQDVNVVKLRLHLLEPYASSEVFLDAGTADVSHAIDPADQHQAVIHIGFADSATQDAFHDGTAWQNAIPVLQGLFAALHPFRLTRTYTWKVAGQPTLAALRGAHVVDQIRALGAANQVQPDTLALFESGFGSVGALQLD